MGDHLKIITETYVSKQIYLFLEPDEVFPCQTEICQWQSMFATSLFNTNVVVIFLIVWGGGGVHVFTNFKKDVYFIHQLQGICILLW